MPLPRPRTFAQALEALSTLAPQYVRALAPDAGAPGVDGPACAPPSYLFWSASLKRYCADSGPALRALAAEYGLREAPLGLYGVRVTRGPAAPLTIHATSQLEARLIAYATLLMDDLDRLSI